MILRVTLKRVASLVEKFSKSLTEEVLKDFLYFFFLFWERYRSSGSRVTARVRSFLLEDSFSSNEIFQLSSRSKARGEEIAKGEGIYIPLSLHVICVSNIAKEKLN